MTPDRILIRGGTLIDGNGGAPVPDGALLVEGERIRAVGPRSDVERTLRADEAFRVDDGPGHEIPGEEPRAVRIDALPFRGPYRH